MDGSRVTRSASREVKRPVAPSSKLGAKNSATGTDNGPCRISKGSQVPSVAKQQSAVEGSRPRAFDAVSKKRKHEEDVESGKCGSDKENAPPPLKRVLLTKADKSVTDTGKTSSLVVVADKIGRELKHVRKGATAKAPGFEQPKTMPPNKKLSRTTLSMDTAGEDSTTSRTAAKAVSLARDVQLWGNEDTEDDGPIWEPDIAPATTRQIRGVRATFTPCFGREADDLIASRCSKRHGAESERWPSPEEYRHSRKAKASGNAQAERGREICSLLMDELVSLSPTVRLECSDGPSKVAPRMSQWQRQDYGARCSHLDPSSLHYHHKVHQASTTAWMRDKTRSHLVFYLNRFW